MPYTLVQHSGHVVGRKPSLEQAVEEYPIRTERERRCVERAGGIVIPKYSDARELARVVNFGHSKTSLIPKARGSFVRRNKFPAPIFIPEKTDEEA